MSEVREHRRARLLPCGKAARGGVRRGRGVRLGDVRPGAATLHACLHLVGGLSRGGSAGRRVCEPARGHVLLVREMQWTLVARPLGRRRRRQRLQGLSSSHGLSTGRWMRLHHLHGQAVLRLLRRWCVPLDEDGRGLLLRLRVRREGMRFARSRQRASLSGTPRLGVHGSGLRAVPARRQGDHLLTDMRADVGNSPGRLP